MMHRSPDQRVLGYLGRALSLELSAVQQYSTQARLVAAWGLNEPA
ncbi:MAG: bacterioferritin, partial [Gammaproteobacteria bacterium]